MLHYYLDVVWRMLVSFKQAVFAFEAGFGVLLFGLVLFNQPLLATAIGNWDGISTAWAWVPIALVFGHLFLKAIYEKHAETERIHSQTISELSQRLAEHTERELQIDFSVRGQQQDRFFIQICNRSARPRAVSVTLDRIDGAFVQGLPVHLKVEKLPGQDKPLLQPGEPYDVLLLIVGRKITIPTMCDFDSPYHLTPATGHQGAFMFNVSVRCDDSQISQQLAITWNEASRTVSAKLFP